MDRESAITIIDNSGTNLIEALQFITIHGKAADIKAVYSHTNSEDNSIKLIAAAAVSSIIRRALITEYKNSKNNIKEKLLKLVHQLDPTIIHEVLYLLNNSNEDTRLTAIKTIEHIDSKPFKKQIISHLLENGDEKIRATTVNLLENIKGIDNKSIFPDLITDPDSRVRANAVEVIENLQDDNLIYLLYRLKTDPNNRVRANTLKALYKSGKKRVKEEIFRMIEINDPLMQASALWVITQIKLKDSVTKMHCQMLQHSSNEVVAKQAKNALRMINSLDLEI